MSEGLQKTSALQLCRLINKIGGALLILGILLLLGVLLLDKISDVFSSDDSGINWTILIAMGISFFIIWIGYLMCNATAKYFANYLRESAAEPMEDELLKAIAEHYLSNGTEDPLDVHTIIAYHSEALRKEKEEKDKKSKKKPEKKKAAETNW